MGYTEKKEEPPPPKETKPASVNNSPHFYRKGTTPSHTPEHSPGPTPPPSPPIYKKTPDTSCNKGSSSSVNKDVSGASLNRQVSKSATKQNSEWKQPKSPAYSTTTAGNGQLHSAYHGYLVRTEVKLPPDEPEDHANPSPMSLGRQPPPPKPTFTRLSPIKSSVKEKKLEPKLKKQLSVVVPEPKKLLKSQADSVEESEEMEESVCIYHMPSRCLQDLVSYHEKIIRIQAYPTVVLVTSCVPSQYFSCPFNNPDTSSGNKGIVTLQVFQKYIHQYKTIKN